MSLCAISYCKQDISRTNLWIFAKFIAVTPYTLPWKWLIFGADYIQKIADNEFPKICSFHTGYFLSGVNSALWRITLYWLSNMAVDKHHSACSSSCFYHTWHTSVTSFQHLAHRIITISSGWMCILLLLLLLLLGRVTLVAQRPIVIKLSHERSVGRSVRTYVRRSVCLSVCLLSSTLWKNGRSDPDAIWRHRSDGSRDDAGSGV